MMLIYSMWQNIRVLLFATKINQFSIISIEMNQFIFILKIWILRMTLCQNLLFTFLLDTSTFRCGFTLSKEIVKIVEIGLWLWILYLLCMLS